MSDTSFFSKLANWLSGSSDQVSDESIDFEDEEQVSYTQNSEVQLANIDVNPDLQQEFDELKIDIDEEYTNFDKRDLSEELASKISKIVQQRRSK